MPTRYTAVFEWEGDAPAIGAGDGWLGGRLVRLSFEEEPVGDGDHAIPLTNSELFRAIQRGLDDLRIQAAHREQHEVEINGVMYRTTNKKLVEEIQRQGLEIQEIQEMNGRLIAANRTLQNVRGQLATSQRNETVGRMSRAGLSEGEAVAVIRAIHLDSPKGYSAHDTVQLVRNIAEAADEVRAARIRKLAAESSVPLSNPFEAMAERADAQASLEEEHRYLSSALLSRCGPRAIGETWVDYARRCMGQS